ncbi:MAG: RluA family pseudouridine synthase [Candidatus Pacebacteria bacterium]|nr:RluA family pseudouridine synthase [Candidatus Paceibacterota bacterium]
MEIYTYTEQENQRIDVFLAEKLDLSRSKIQKLIKSGDVCVNDKVIKKTSFLLVQDDKIKVSLTEDPEEIIVPDDDITLDIVFQNQDFLILNKPAFLSMHPTNFSQSNTLANYLIKYFPNLKNVGEDKLRPGIVHRLDKDTSGLLIIPLNNESFFEFKTKFQNKEIKKTYIALVSGKLKEKQGVLDIPITKSQQKFNRRKVAVVPDKFTKEAITEYEVLREFKNESLLKVNLKTGRTHQIRVHFAAISNFIIGDTEYGSTKVNKKYDLNRQFLHSSQLDFNFKNKEYSFSSDLPKDLSNILENLKS